jgi:hypothetical protein
MTNVAFADFSDFLEADIANILLAELAVAAHWSNGPVHSVISTTGSLTNTTGQVFGLRGTVQTDELVKMQMLVLASGHTPTLSVTGTVPAKVIPGRGEGMLVWDESQRIALAGDWKDDQAEGFPIPLGTRDRLDVSRPELSFRVAGTRSEPSAELTAGATKLTWQSKTNNAPLPRLEDLKLAVEIRPDTIRLKTFAAKLDGQPIMATGEWPLPKEAWRELWSTGKRPDWNQAQGHLELEEAQVAGTAVELVHQVVPGDDGVEGAEPGE